MKISKVIKNGKNWYFIDTCQLTDYLGNMLDRMGFGNDDATPFGYETMVFKCDKNGNVSEWGALDKRNYQTEQEAKVGHKEMIKKWAIKGNKPD